MIEQPPVVSVCCITYNHEQYIAQTIESVLAQVTDFTIELVIGEDCSTDSTRAIAQRYEAQYPGLVRVLTPEKNIGIMPNLIATFNACRGEFIALVEGDDYWTDVTKLQQQVEALRANSACSFCFHDAETFLDGDPAVVWTYSGRFAHILPPVGSLPTSYTQADLARWGWFLPTASMLIRAASLPQPLPAWLAGVHSGDFTIQLLSTRYGPAYYLPQIMSRYRLHPTSITATTTDTPYQYERHIYAGKMFQQHVFDEKHRKLADIYLAQQYKNYSGYFGRKGQWWQQLHYLAKAAVLNLQRIPLYLERRGLFK
jgi:glycosyltransferase involved in cell wall biosynthesis